MLICHFEPLRLIVFAELLTVRVIIICLQIVTCIYGLGKHSDQFVAGCQTVVCKTHMSSRKSI
jgi:hypothetical protein